MPRQDSNEDLRPGPWNWKDAFSFGGVSVVATALALYAQVKGVEGPSSAYTLLWVVAGTFWFIYGVLVWSRWRFINRYDLVLPNGTMVRTNGYKATLVEFERELERISLLWVPFFLTAPELLKMNRIWVSFEPKVLKQPFSRETPKTFAGLTSMGGESVRLTYFENPNLPLQKTAFAHEMGHIILGRATKKWDNDEHHTYMKEHKLP